MHTVNLLYLESVGLQSGPRVLRQTDSTPLSVFMRFFFEIIQLLVEERNSCRQYLDTGRRTFPHCLTWIFKKFIGSWQLLFSCDQNMRTLWRFNSLHRNSFTRPITGKLQNMTHSIICLDSCVFVTSRKDLDNTDDGSTRLENEYWNNLCFCGIHPFVYFTI
jgi:hypothetical protein